MELILVVEVYSDKSFEIYRAFISPLQRARDSVITLDYNYTPWPRPNGNLLWQ